MIKDCIYFTYCIILILEGNMQTGRKKVKVAQSCPILCDPMDCSPQNSPGQNTGEGSLSLLQGIFPTQGSNSGLPCCRRILYQLSHQGSPKMLKWVAYPFSSRSSRPRNPTGVSSIAGGFFTNRAIREVLTDKDKPSQTENPLVGEIPIYPQDLRALASTQRT